MFSLLTDPIEINIHDRRFRTTDVPSAVSKGAPPFCTVYIISKGKISSVRSATAPLTPKPVAARNQLQPQQVQPMLQPQPRHQPLMRNPEGFLDSHQTRNYPPRRMCQFIFLCIYVYIHK